ncbi:MAG: hypothetical protein ABSB68_07960 [Acidimicrobiales bacterium]
MPAAVTVQWNRHRAHATSAGRRSRRRLQVGAAAALVGILLALGGGWAGASSGVVVKEPQYGFSLTLPADWKPVPLDGSDVTALLNAATHDDPALTNALKGQISAAASKGMKVFAVGPIVGSSVPNLNVIVSSSAGAPTGRAFAPAALVQAKIEFAELAASHVKASVVDNRMGHVAQVTYELSAKNLGTEFGEQYYLQHKAYLEIVTITTSNPAGTRADAQLIVNSWRW